MRLAETAQCRIAVHALETAALSGPDSTLDSYSAWLRISVMTRINAAISLGTMRSFASRLMRLPILSSGPRFTGSTEFRIVISSRRNAANLSMVRFATCGDAGAEIDSVLRYALVVGRLVSEPPDGTFT